MMEIMDDLMHHYPPVKLWEDKLLDRFSDMDRHHRKIKGSDRHHRKIEGSDFSAIHKDLNLIAKELRKDLTLIAKEYQTNGRVGTPKLQNAKSFAPLSEPELRIIRDADKNPIFKCLRVSYELLEKDLKDCLLRLAIFPENAVLKKRLLIYWWIGEGLVTNEKEGGETFDQLLERGLIMPHRNDKCPSVNKCQIHPWIRYMLIIVATRAKILCLDREIPRFETQNNHPRTCLIDEPSSVTSKNGSDMEHLESKNGSEMENLKTIFNVNQSYLDLQLEWLAKQKSLEVLQLGRWMVSSTHHIEVRGESFLKGLRTQKQLKFLSLRGVSRITELPSFIGELINLEILDLKACHNLETLPADVVSLKKLTHLDVSECYLLESMPKGLGKLTSLQVLKGFIIGSSQETTIGIEDLRKLERLSIHIGSESVINNEFEKLKDLRNVRCLKISWGVVREDQFLEESLSFPPKLEKLDLQGIPHDTMPQWLKPSRLEKLKKLYIMGGNLSSLGQVQTEEHWNVKYLILKYTDKLQIDKQTVRKLFPSIEYAKKVRWIKGGGTSTTPGRELIDFELNN